MNSNYFSVPPLLIPLDDESKVIDFSLDILWISIEEIESFWKTKFFES